MIQYRYGYGNDMQGAIDNLLLIAMFYHDENAEIIEINNGNIIQYKLKCKNMSASSNVFEIKVNAAKVGRRIIYFAQCMFE